MFRLSFFSFQFKNKFVINKSEDAINYTVTNYREQPISILLDYSIDVYVLYMVNTLDIH